MQLPQQIFRTADMKQLIGFDKLVGFLYRF